MNERRAKVNPRWDGGYPGCPGQEHGHIYCEAFCHMLYESDDTREREVLWNSRDGVTPFIIFNRDKTKQMKHIAWNRDLYDPDYVPQPGDRIFVDVTEEMARERAVRYVEREWENTESEAGPMKDGSWATKEEAVECLTREWSKPGSPTVITVEAKE